MLDVTGLPTWEECEKERLEEIEKLIDNFYESHRQQYSDLLTDQSNIDLIKGCLNDFYQIAYTEFVKDIDEIEEDIYEDLYAYNYDKIYQEANNEIMVSMNKYLSI